MRKERKRKALAALVCGSMLTVALVGGTLAYLTDTDSDVNVMTLGDVSINQHEYERVVEDGEFVEGVAGEDFEANYGITRSYKLKEFTQGKPAMPAVYANGKIAWDEFQQLWNQVNAPGSNELFDNSMKNVIDKFVFVENTGKSDAYYRTIIAIEDPAGLAEEAIHTNFNGNNRFDYNADKDGVQNAIDSDEFHVTIDGVRYLVYTATYTEKLAPGEVSRPSLLQLYLDPTVTNEDCALFGDEWEVKVLSQAVQVEGFGSAAEALNKAFGEVDGENVAEWFGGMEVVSVSTEEALEEALTANDENIFVSLDADVTYDVAAWQNDAMGGDATKTITIYGNGHTITFNQTNSDWNNIVTNGAKLVINNAHLTNAGHNNGPWNRHDLNFACDVELNGVTSDKALAFKAGAVLNNVTIADANTSDTYAIWIQPNGQTVTLNGCTIDMLDCSDGRGIKIDEQYVGSPQKVTLKVSDTVFKTEEKSAILVKCVAGADIVLDEVDITDVAADSTNPVWVDEASSAYANLVTVTGGSKIVEP